MTKYLDIDVEELNNKEAYWTAKEISQQPNIWRQTEKLINANNFEVSAFLEPIMKLDNLRVILTGAGTSAYLGETLAPHLSKEKQTLFEAISTTDIVSNPHGFLLKDTPTLIISYARSGNSPESLAAVELATQIIDNCYHLVITCNPDGKLAQGTKANENSYSLIMPEGTLDESFAMTSSFTSMLVSTLCIFTPDNEQLELAAKITDKLLINNIELIKQHAKNDCERIVFLGSGSLMGVAREAALKFLELTSGDVLSYFESPLGFRHGPKSLVNGKTDIILLSSNDSYTKVYDKDLFDELVKDDVALSVVKLSDVFGGFFSDLDDVWAGLPMITYCQILSFYKSLDLKLSPDNPCPTGEVNRVVQGVSIYPLEEVAYA
jgi:tagatose-6-phosphate ketose/aldose isomerase